MASKKIDNFRGWEEGVPCVHAHFKMVLKWGVMPG